MIVRGTFPSSILKRDTSLCILTPRTLPNDGLKVLYLFHGAWGDANTWLDYSMLADLAKDGDTMVVMPSVEDSYYQGAAFRYVSEELPQAVSSLFRTKGKAAVMGASLGGYGALRCALTYPDRYCFAASFSSPCLFLNEALDLGRQDEKQFKQLYGIDIYSDFKRLFPSWERQDKSDISALSQQLKGEKPRIALYCGTIEFFKNDNRKMANVLKQSGFPVTYEEFEGKHDFAFFNQALAKAWTVWQEQPSL